MSKKYEIELAGVKYPLGAFKLGQVARCAVLIKQCGNLETLQEYEALMTLVWIALQTGGYSDSYEAFKNMEHIKVFEKLTAQIEVGRAIGYYLDKDKPAGENPAGEATGAPVAVSP